MSDYRDHVKIELLIRRGKTLKLKCSKNVRVYNILNYMCQRFNLQRSQIRLTTKNDLVLPKMTKLAEIDTNEMPLKVQKLETVARGLLNMM